MTTDVQRPAAARLAEILRQRREDARLSQAQVAARSGLARPTVSAYESGARTPSFATADRLLAALGVQLRLETEPLGADLDAEIEAIAGLTIDRRLSRHLLLLKLLAQLDPLPFVIEGALAGLVQGVPAPVRELTITIAEASLDILALRLRRLYAQRWNEAWRDYGYADPDPRLPGPMRWHTNLGELIVTVAPALPASLTIQAGGRLLPVRPLAEIEAADPRTARLLARVRQRSGLGSAS